MKKTLATLISATSFSAIALAGGQLNYCLEANPDNLDPTQSTAQEALMPGKQIYESLVTLDAKTGLPVARLATKWEVSADGLTYTFHLRDDVNFQSNSLFKPTRKMNADDVVFSLNRQIGRVEAKYTQKNAIYEWAEAMDWKNVIKDVKAVDSQTVVITLIQPDATFLIQMYMPQGYIFSKEYADKLVTTGKYDQFSTQPIGTGPYKFTEFKKDDYVRLTKNNDGYWGAKNNIDRINMAITVDPSVRVTKLEKGECDFITSVPFTALDGLNGEKGIKVVATSTMMGGYLALNTRKPYLNNTYVRQAIKYAIDYDKVMKDVYKGRAERLNTMMPNNLIGHTDSIPLPKRDIKKAKELMKKAGYPNGFETKIWAMPVTRPYQPAAKDFATILQQNLAEIGIKADIVSYEWGEYIKRAYKQGEGDLVTMGWIDDIPDPDNFVTPLYTCSSVNVNNPAMYCNKEFDKLAAQAKATTDEKARLELYKQIQEMFDNDTPVIPLAQPKYYYGINANKIDKYELSDYYSLPEFIQFSLK